MNIVLYAVLIPYLIGSIPFGLLISYAFGYEDVRKIGSKNIGATNVLRTGSKAAAILTLLGDGGKGFLAVYLCNQIIPAQSGMAMLFVILGHCFSPWLGFKGGKGVATYIGSVFGIFWPMGLMACAFWIIAAFSRKISSLAALTMVIMMIVMAWMFTPHYLWWFVIVAALIIYQHRENIKRIREGTEPTIGKK